MASRKITEKQRKIVAETANNPKRHIKRDTIALSRPEKTKARRVPKSLGSRAPWFRPYTRRYFRPL